MCLPTAVLYASPVVLVSLPVVIGGGLTLALSTFFMNKHGLENNIRMQFNA